MYCRPCCGLPDQNLDLSKPNLWISLCFGIFSVCNLPVTLTVRCDLPILLREFAGPLSSYSTAAVTQACDTGYTVTAATVQYIRRRVAAVPVWRHVVAATANS